MNVKGEVCPWNVQKISLWYPFSVESDILGSEDVFLRFSVDYWFCKMDEKQFVLILFENWEISFRKLWILKKAFRDQFFSQMILSVSTDSKIAMKQSKMIPFSHPFSSKTNKNIVDVHDLVHSDHRLTILRRWLINWI